VGFIGLVDLLAWGPALNIISIAPFNIASSYDFICLPFFMLMANIVLQSGLGKELYDVAAKWLGFLPGGLAIATVGACGGFAAMSGSSVAGHATMSPVALPEMKRFGYSPSLSTGCIAAGGTVGILIPPSGILILYGVLTETSIGKLFLAGIIPGVLEVLFYIITIYILCVINPALGPRGPRYSLKEKVIVLKGSGEMIVLVALVLGGLIIGWFTPTEAGAVGAFGAILTSSLRRRLNWQKFYQAVLDTVKITGMIYIIVISAYIFMPFLALTTLPAALSEFVSSLPLPPKAIMFIVILLYIILGMFMDTMAMILITIPIFFPLALELGFGPLWFGIIVVRVMEIGMITPPMGLGIWVISGITNTPLDTISKGIIPFLIADILHVVTLLFIPSVVMFLPNIL
jgi:tripartite ATP-independent transporter DctM subunit